MQKTQPAVGWGGGNPAGGKRLGPEGKIWRPFVAKASAVDTARAVEKQKKPG